MSDIFYPLPSGITKVLTPGGGFISTDGGVAPLDPLTVSDLRIGIDCSDVSRYILNGNEVVSYTEKSSNAYVISQSVVARRPTKDGDAIVFDGSQWLFYDDGSPGTIMAGDRDITIMILGNIQLTGTTDQYFATLASSSNNHNWQAGTRAWPTSSDGTFIYRSPPSGSGGELFNAGGPTSGNVQTIVFRRDHSGEGEYTFWVDGVRQFTGATTVTGTITNGRYLTVGGSNWDGALGRRMVGTIRQMWIYGRALNIDPGEEMLGILAYLDTKR